MLMDIFSAIVVVVPLITPSAIQYGIDPYHLGIVFLLNLEIGYLTPPVGLNLFIASFKFDKPIVSVVRASWPFLAMMLVALGLVTYIPALTVVPEAKRTGRVTSLAETVRDAREVMEMAKEIPLPDGKLLKYAECDAYTDEMQKLACQGMFKDYSACEDKDDPDACRQDVVKTYLEDTADDWDDDEDENTGANAADAGPAAAGGAADAGAGAAAPHPVDDDTEDAAAP
jgi:hypothetical protein